MKNVVLVGFMGTGKTAVAKKLALELGREYISIDALIEKDQKMAISEIFEKHGEKYFREIEKRIVENISSQKGKVFDTGGGIVLENENIVSLKKNGIIICLWTEPEVIHCRTKRHKHRPLLNVDDPMKRIKELLETRKPFYEKADFHINTTNMDIDEVVKEIRKIVYDTENQ
ncbi:MAG: shikimate kinase [Candidatus Omnitrophica bacterium]|nr:shikimate kinase [Candidatus Omnitrophota bacterium]